MSISTVNNTALVAASDTLVQQDTARAGGGNVVALRQDTTVAADKPLSATEAAQLRVAEAQAKAYESLAKYVSDTSERIKKYDQQRDAALAVLREPKPAIAMKMNQTDWAEFLRLKADAMRAWNDGANDCGGHNKRESNAINMMDTALTNNGMYLTLDQAKEMLALANANGLQGNGGSFEDGAWQATYNAVRSYSQGARMEYDKQVEAWTQRQNTAKAELANVSSLLTSTQDSFNATVSTIKDMRAGQARSDYQQSLQSLPDTSNSPTRKAEEDVLEAQQPIKVQLRVNLPQWTANNSRLSLKLALAAGDAVAGGAYNIGRPADSVGVQSRFQLG
jgi:phage baseplate assembly protein gpV